MQEAFLETKNAVSTDTATGYHLFEGPIALRH